jgi:hypothetical protein
MIGADRLKNREASGFELVRDVKADDPRQQGPSGHAHLPLHVPIWPD